MMTALYPATVDIADNASMLCARVVRGISSTENEMIPLAAMSVMLCSEPIGRKNPTRI